MLATGQLERLVENGVTGLTSNPTIFQKALAAGDWYDGEIRHAAAAGLDRAATYERLAVGDIQAVADLLTPVYDNAERTDGYVSLEVSPTLAYDAKESVIEARRLWTAVGRPNLMIKIPATHAGLPAITTLLTEGINVNVTLIFGLQRYRQVLEAHRLGLAGAKAGGRDLSGIASVASFFVSRVDTLVDRLLELKAGPADDPGKRNQLLALRGKTAIANAKVARTIWEQWLDDDPMRDLSAEGARPQRLLWASTTTRNPAYRDVLYVEELIGPDTVNTMPLQTIANFVDHGVVRGATLTEARDEAAATLDALAGFGVNMESVAEELEAAGVQLFERSIAQLLDELGAKVGALRVGGRT